MSDTQTEAPARPARSRKVLYLVAAVVLIAAAGAGGYVAFARSAGAAGAPAEEPRKPPAIVNFDPFVVNLADPGGARFLRLTIGVVVDGEHEAKEFAEDDVVRMQTRSSILEMLSQHRASDLVTPDGKAGLKKAIVEHVSRHAAHLKVRDVLFSEFIVQ